MLHDILLAPVKLTRSALRWMRSRLIDVEVSDEKFELWYSLMFLVTAIGILISLISILFSSYTLFMLGILITIAPDLFDRFNLFLTFSGDVEEHE